MSEIPTILYKYRCWDNPNDSHQFQRRILTDSEIYLSSAEQFNDPFDSSTPHRYKKEDLTRDNLYKKLLIVSSEQWPHLTQEQLTNICNERINSGVFENERYWKENHNSYLKSVNEILGLFSMSALNNNLLMWSHYADSHRGFCVGLNVDLFSELTGSICQVSYDNKFPELGLFDDSLENFLSLFTTKSLDWSYEKEYRILKVNYAKKTIKLTNNCITEIILGCKMKDEHKKEIAKIIDTKFKHANIYQSELNSEEFKIDIKKLK
jgi:hypothetical protein